VTHAVVTGMTGSGKTGLLTVLIEEPLRSSVPVLIVDVKGDLPDLLFRFPRGNPQVFVPWIDTNAPQYEGRPVDEIANRLYRDREAGLDLSGIYPDAIESYRQTTSIRLLTPGSTAGEPIHLLSSLERRSPVWDTDPETARNPLANTISLVLRLLGRDSDPAASKDHVLLSVLAEKRLREGRTADLASLIQDIEDPPIEQVGAMAFDRLLCKTERQKLAASLNALLASPTFETWRCGVSLDVAEWLKPSNGKTPAVIVSVAHLDDQERASVLGVILEEVNGYVRGLPETSALRSLIVFDEVYGYLPPHPSNPPTKRPLVALMKQARAFGVGVVVATQNPMDLDYRALSDAGLWFVGRLQTDADRERVVEGMSGASDKEETQDLDKTIKHLSNRWFLQRSVYQ